MGVERAKAPNLVLRHIREVERRETREEFAAAVVIAGRQLGDDHLGCDARLVAGVNLVSSWPEHLKTPLARTLRLGDKDVYWQGWPTEYLGGDTISYYEPGEADVAARPYLLATISLQFTVPSATLPKPPASSAALLSAGQQAVAMVMAKLNRIVGPVLSVGLGGTPPAMGRGW